jgi:hypothetical protein
MKSKALPSMILRRERASSRIDDKGAYGILGVSKSLLVIQGIERQYRNSEQHPGNGDYDHHFNKGNSPTIQ